MSDRPGQEKSTSVLTRGTRLAAALSAALLLASAPALAQGWWPWSNEEPERPPVPDEPIYRDQGPREGDPSQQGRPPSADWSTKNPICLQLEQRLVQDSQRSGQTQNELPRLESQIRQIQRTMQATDQELERRRCYEYFLFSKSLRRTRACIDLARQKEEAKAQVSDLESRRQQIMGSPERSYRDEIVQELARNNCGANYTQEARRQHGGPSSSVWQDEEGGSYSNDWTPYGAPAYATYRTICVRLCDGYYFPVSFSTLPSHFQQDEAACQSKCAAPVELYYYQNPGSSVAQSVALRSQEPYTSLKTAFRYRKQLVAGCSCKTAEYQPPDTPETGKRAESATDGWAARSDWEARSR
jgi:hypothetical protein